VERGREAHLPIRVARRRIQLGDGFHQGNRVRTHAGCSTDHGFSFPLRHFGNPYVGVAAPIGARIRRRPTLRLRVTKRPQFAKRRSRVDVSMLVQIVFDRLVELGQAVLEVVADQWDFADVARRSFPTNIGCRLPCFGPFAQVEVTASQHD